MTTRTVRLERRCRPGHGFGIAAMAIRAVKILPVITRIVRRRMSEGGRRPGERGVAGVALTGRIEVPVVASGGRDTIMTTGTGSRGYR